LNAGLVFGEGEVVGFEPVAGVGVGVEAEDALAGGDGDVGDGDLGPAIEAVVEGGVEFGGAVVAGEDLGGVLAAAAFDPGFEGVVAGGEAGDGLGEVGGVAGGGVLAEGSLAGVGVVGIAVGAVGGVGGAEPAGEGALGAEPTDEAETADTHEDAGELKGFEVFENKKVQQI